jgi:hypothetical protein
MHARTVLQRGGAVLSRESGTESEHARAYASTVALAGEDSDPETFTTGSTPPDNVCPKPTSYGEKAEPSVLSLGGFAVCGFSATLTTHLYICCRNGLTESVPKRTMIWALTHGFRVEAP